MKFNPGYYSAPYSIQEFARIEKELRMAGNSARAGYFAKHKQKNNKKKKKGKRK